MKSSGDSVNGSTIDRYAWTMFVLCFLGNVLGGTTSTLMSVYLPTVANDLLGHVDPTRLNGVSAFISSWYFLGWAIGGLAWGVIGDRIGRVRSLATAVGMFGLFTLLTGFASSWQWVTIFRFFCGFGVGGTLVINTTLLSEVWPERTKVVFIGILSIGFPVGIFSSGIVNYFVPAWRHGFMIGMLPLAVGIATLWLRESESWKTTKSGSRQRSQQDFVGNYRRDLLMGSVIFGSMLISLWAVFSWLPTWVQSLLSHVDGRQERSLSMMILGAGGLSGGFLSGWISNVFGMRKTMAFCFLGCFVLCWLLFKLNVSFTWITVIEMSVLAMLFGISQGLLSFYIPLIFPVSVRATATGFCFNAARFFTAAAVFFVGATVSALGGYGNAIFVFSWIFLLGFVTVVFAREPEKIRGLQSADSINKKQVSQ
jgi:MFS family permease